jgi:hypothetical protein
MAGLLSAKCGAIAGAILLVTAGCSRDRRLGQPVPTPPAPSGLAFINATLVDVETGQLRPRFTVIITGNRITAADSASAVRIPAGVRVLNVDGKYLIPGLTDTHVHLLSEWTNPPVETSAYFGWILAGGVTSVREMSKNGFERAIRMRADARDGRLLVPRIYCRRAPTRHSPIHGLNFLSALVRATSPQRSGSSRRWGLTASSCTIFRATRC